MLKYLSIITLPAAIVLIAALSGPSRAGEFIENSGFSGEKTTIKYATWGGADDLRNAQECCQLFVAGNPDIRIDLIVIPWGQYWAKLQSQAASGLAPDVITLYSGDMGVWIKRGALLPLDDFVSRSGLHLDDYHRVVVDLCRWDNTLFCMPTGITVRTVVYSLDRLEESGLAREVWPRSDKPMSWDQFKLLAAKLTLRNSDGTFSQYGMAAGHNWSQTLIRMYGGTIVDREVDPTVSTVENNEALIQGLIEVYRTQYADRCIQGFIPLSSGGVRNLDAVLISPQYAMGLTGPWALRTLKDAGVRFGLMPMPRGPVPSQLIYGNALGISKDSRTPEAAWRFIHFMVSSEMQDRIGRNVRGVPSLISAQDALIHNDVGIQGCEAFVYDLPIASADLCASETYVLEAREKWLAGIERLFDQEYDRRLRALPQTAAGIRSEDYSAFVAGMNEFIEQIVRERIPELDEKMKLALSRGRPIAPNFQEKVVWPAVMLLVFLGAGLWYIFWFRRNTERQPVPALRQDNWAGYICISPWLAGFLVFSLLPIAASILLSFTEWNMIRPPQWVGLRNYLHLGKDEYFLMGLRKTFAYAAWVIPISLVGGLTTAGLLTCKMRGGGFFKSVFYFPSLFTGAAMAVLWVNMFNKEYGVINELLAVFHIPPVNWLDEAHAFTTVILMNFFWVGGAMIIYYAGMKQVPASLYEAADIDGAGPIRKFLFITIPMLSPVILFMVIMSTIGAFQIFTPALFFASDSSQIGGPGNALRLYSVNIYNEAFNNLRMGNACSYAIILFVIIFLITMVQLKLSRRFVHQS